jgi:hypothetical protein
LIGAVEQQFDLASSFPFALFGRFLLPPVAFCRIVDDPSRRIALFAGRAVKLPPAIERLFKFFDGAARYLFDPST